MSLWDLLTLLPLPVAIGSAMGTAAVQGAGYSGRALTAGFLLGTLCTWAARFVGRVDTAAWSMGMLRLLYLGASARVLAAGVLGALAARLALAAS